MPSSKRRQPVQRRSQEMVARILEAAAQLLVQDGYEGLSTNSVAERAEISIGTIYRYFVDKDQLLIALRDRASAEITASLHRAAAKALTKPPNEGVHIMVETLVGELEAHRGVTAALVSAVPLGTQSNVLPDVEQQLAHIARLLLAHHRPDLPDDEAELLTYLGMGVTLAACLRIAVNRPPHLDRNDLIERTANLLTTILATTPKNPRSESLVT
jgi:AcrR family transcriptional regulator